MFLEDAVILENRQLDDIYYLMKVKAPVSVLEAKAGQFYMIRLRNGIRILRRPISIHSIDKKEGTLEFYYEALGKGTEELATYEAGTEVDIQGPLGKGVFSLTENKKCLVVGGGLGIAPLKELIKQLLAKGNEVTFIAGGRNAAALKVMENIKFEDIKTIVMSDNGEVGKKGLVTIPLKGELEASKYDMVYTCGPDMMMKAVANICEDYKVTCEVSLEERMACGVKACMGCSFPTPNGMKKVCADGPVFLSTEVNRYAK